MPRKAASKKADLPRVIVDAALECAATKGWSATRLNDIAQAAGVSLADLRRHFASKNAVLSRFSTMIDDAVLLGQDAETETGPARERLFDVVMRRFDALAPYKDGVRSVLSAALCDPEAALCGASNLRRSMRWTLEAANINSAGLRGALRVKGLSVLYLAVLRVWLRDETEDMAQTMAALDRQLRRADRMAAWLERGPRRRAATGDETSSDTVSNGG